MLRRVLSVLLLLACLPPSLGAKGETWIQVTSPHFVVVTNGGEKSGRRVADQFERMRSLFHGIFPKAQMDNGSPIIVLAIRDEKDFRALEPEAYLKKGSLRLGGLFQRAPDKNYVLMRLDAEGEHPYEVIYHEYTHFLLSKAQFIPLWLNEGMAEFYENTDIHEKDALLGQPNASSLYWLQQNRLLPLSTLFAVDFNSPYYHEENKGSIFYAESWALTHYLEIGDFEHKTHRITDYLELVEKQTDPVTAASQAFGDLNKLQKELDGYVHRSGGFSAFRTHVPTEVDDSAFKAQVLTEPQADALRADFLAYTQRTADAEALLDQVLKADPNNVSAHETKGAIEFRQGNLDEAKKWYAKAVQLDSQSYMAHYYFAAIAMNSSRDEEEQQQVENSLRAAIKLNPNFAPAFDRLGVYMAMHHKNLDEARMMELNAISLDPSDIGYRVNMAHILMTMEKGQSAVDVLKFAAKLAKTPAEVREVNDSLDRAEAYATAQTEMEEEKKDAGEKGQVTTSSESRGPIPQLKRRPPEFVAKGPHRFVTGVMKNVHCDNPALDLTVDASGKLVALHVDNYYNIKFSALGFQPGGDLNPCSDLENRPAKVEYVESANPSVNAQLISVELHK